MEITGYENYLIYDDGRVYSKTSKKFLKPSLRKDNYIHIGLCKNGIEKKYYAHRLVAEHYLPNPFNKKDVDHINRIRSDKRLENLRWVTSSENCENTKCRKNK